MSPSLWVAVIMGLVILCWIVAIFDEIANGTDAHRTKEQIDADVEAMLKEANQDVAQRPRIRAGSIND